jgi:formate hydrogenlyase subunit 6/NADH:ubiquinone oxidoreductase subunit I
MSQADSKVTRRQFVAVGSAAAATPFLAEFGVTEAYAQDNTAVGEIAKGTKVYYIKDQCVGCQVCRVNCPAEAIRYGNCRNEIMQDKCIHCGVCYEACHINNISETVMA